MQQLRWLPHHQCIHGKLLQKAQLMHCCIMLLLHYMQSRHTDKLSYLIPNVPGNNEPGPLCNLDTMTSCLISPHMSNVPLRRPDINVMVDWALKINYLSYLSGNNQPSYFINISTQLWLEQTCSTLYLLMKPNEHWRQNAEEGCYFGV